MKKFISFILFAALILSLSIFSAADGKTTEVSYTVQESYVMTIPPSIELSETAITQSVSLTDVLLANGREAVLTVASANAYKVVNGAASIPYSVSVEETTLLSLTNPFELLRTDKASESVKMSFAVSKENIESVSVVGKYVDTLTFAVTVEDKTPSQEQGKETIEFTLGEKHYPAESGMTWEEFVESKYNVDTFFIDGNCVFVNNEREYICFNNEEAVSADEIIDPKKAYTIH